MRIFLRLLKYAKPYIKVLVLVFIATIFLNLATLAQPLLIKYLLNKVLIKKNLYFLNLIIIALIILVIVKGLFYYAQNYLMNYVGQATIKKLKDDLFFHIQFLPMTFFDKWRSGEIYSRLISDISVLIDVFRIGIINLINDTIVILGALGWMFYKSWRLTLVTLVVLPLIGIAVARFGKWMGQVTKKTQEKVADLSSVIYEDIFAIKEIKSYLREDYFINKFKKENEELFNFLMKGIQVTATQTPVVEFFAVLGIGVVVWYGGYEVIAGKFSVGDIFAFWGYMVLLTNPLYRLSGTFTSFHQATAAAKRVFEILDMKKEDMKEDGVVLDNVKGDIEFRDVKFYYDKDKTILDGMSFKIDAGETVAIVGYSGVGKTTLINLISGFYEVIDGQILIDSIPIDKINLKSLRKNIGIVSQDIFLFKGTIKDNITFFDDSIDLKEVEYAAKLANAHDFIMQFKDGYNTYIHEKGIGLSGGQRQRLAIARLILKDPKIIILDEATSSLDSKSEEQVYKAVDNIIKGKTTIIIAHRLSTIINADKILVIDKGRVVQQGTHQQLIADKNSLYYKLYFTQFKGKLNKEDTAGV